MPICMNGELCLGMVKDIIYSVSSLYQFQKLHSTVYIYLLTYEQAS